MAILFNPFRPNARQTENFNFHYHISLWASKGFMKAFKDFIKPFQAQEISVKIKT